MPYAKFAWHCAFWSSHSATLVTVASPEFASVAQAFFWISHDRPSAPFKLTKVSPLMVKGRLASPLLTTGGAAPPRAPVNVCRLVPLAVELAAVELEARDSSTITRDWWFTMGVAAALAASMRVQREKMVVFILSREKGVVFYEVFFLKECIK